MKEEKLIVLAVLCSGDIMQHSQRNCELVLPLEKEIGRWSHLTYNSALNLKLVWTF